MRTTLFVFLLCTGLFGFAQNKTLDSLRQIVADAKAHDTTRALTLVELCNHYKFNQTDSAFFYGQRALAMSRQIGFPKGEAMSLRFLAATNIFLGNSSKALELYLKCAKVAGRNNVLGEKAEALVQVGNIIRRSQNFTKGLDYLYQAKKILDADTSLSRSLCLSSLTNAYLSMNMLDSAEYYARLTYDYIDRKQIKGAKPGILLTIGRIYLKKGQAKLAMDFFRQSLNYVPDGEANTEIARIFQKSNQLDSAIFYASQVLEAAQKKKSYSGIAGGSRFLAELYESKDPLKALKYNKQAIAAQDSLSKLEQMAAVNNITDFDEKERQYEIETVKAEYRNQIRVYVLLTGLAVISLIAFILYRSDKRQKRSIHLLHQQKQEIEAQRAKVEQALKELKATQAQLIQSEKMASLGELTAGIAHEIQNPLNFVNNFSEISKELVEEIKQETEKGNSREAQSLADEVLVNLDKVVHHGKRADSIVKSMLQHSRGTTGEKELTDLNALVDEHLRLAYHGYRAKNKAFAADVTISYDPTMSKISIVPQEIGRVLLNLFNNAFFAVQEKKAKLNGTYDPVVQVSTKFKENHIIIRVKDNGTGIPPKVADKVFQPFFTTKPTGEGTGLGLSLSYDIITKGHGGNLLVHSQEGEGSEFVVQLPVS